MFPIARAHVEDVRLVSDEAICRRRRHCGRRCAWWPSPVARLRSQACSPVAIVRPRANGSRCWSAAPTRPQSTSARSRSTAPRDGQGIDRSPQHEVLPERPAFVVGAEQAAALQLGDHAVDELSEAAGQRVELHHEAVAGAGREPVLHHVGDVVRRALDGLAAALVTQVELPQRRVLLADDLHDAVEKRLVQVGIFRQAAFGDRLVQWQVGEIRLEIAAETEAADVRVHQFLQPHMLGLGLIARGADHHRHSGQDAQRFRIAIVLRHATLEIDIALLGAGRIGIAREHDLGGAGSEFPAGIGRAGLDDDRMALRRPRDVEGAIDGEEFPRVPGHVHAIRLEVVAGIAVVFESVLVPGVPELFHHVDELAGTLVAQRMWRQLGVAEIPCGVVVGRRDDVPAGTTAGDVVERGELPRDVVGLRRSSSKLCRRARCARSPSTARSAA